jgi:hypothetical protein
MVLSGETEILPGKKEILSLFCHHEISRGMSGVQTRPFAVRRTKIGSYSQRTQCRHYKDNPINAVWEESVLILRMKNTVWVGCTGV